MKIQVDVYNSRGKKPGIYGTGIMIAIGRRYHHSSIRIREYDDENVLISDYVYEAVGKGFVATSYDSWISENIVVQSCNANRKFGLTQADCYVIFTKCVEYVGKDIDYGWWSIGGIILWYVFKAKTFGVDKEARLICSEAVYRVFEKWIGPTDKPVDYINPRDLEEWFF